MASMKNRPLFNGALFVLEEPATVGWIGYNGICRNARFVFDQPFKVELDDTLELTNGCWYLLSKGLRVPLHGRWDR